MGRIMRIKVLSLPYVPAKRSAAWKAYDALQLFAALLQRFYGHLKVPADGVGGYGELYPRADDAGLLGVEMT